MTQSELLEAAKAMVEALDGPKNLTGTLQASLAYERLKEVICKIEQPPRRILVETDKRDGTEASVPEGCATYRAGIIACANARNVTYNDAIELLDSGEEIETDWFKRKLLKPTACAVESVAQSRLRPDASLSVTSGEGLLQRSESAGVGECCGD